MANTESDRVGAAPRRSFWANFWRDVFAEPSIGPVTAWLVGGLVALVAWLTVSYAPGAVERAGACGEAPADASEGVISVEWGFRTLALVAAFTLLAGIQPIIGKRFSSDWADSIADWYARQSIAIRGAAMALGFAFGAIFNLLAWAFSILDWLLARPIALLAGTTLQPWPLRYGAFLGWMALTLAIAWLAPTTIGPFAFFLGVALILGVVRRWSWVERDRETFFVARKQDPAAERVGFAEDLRDEAMIALVFLFLFVPLGLRQLELVHVGTFCIDGADPSQAGALAWFGFFGAELAKAVPFVDWSEVFHVANGSPIEPNTVLGAQVVFAMRATLDLLMIAAVTQAVQLASRLAEQDQAFASGKVDVLEPFMERIRFHALGLALDRAETGRVIEHARVKAFPAYSPLRLAQIVDGGADESAVQAAGDAAARRAALALATKQAVQAERPEEVAPLIGAATSDPMEANRLLALRLAAESVPAALMKPTYIRARALADGGKTDAVALLKDYPERARALALRAIRSALGELDVMVPIPAGAFIMGDSNKSSSQKPTRHARIEPFKIGKFPVTFEEYDAFCEATGYWLKQGRGEPAPSDNSWGRGRQPVINVSWYDAKAYIDWLNSWTAGGYRLPTEAEWEYACRAGTQSAYWFGQASPDAYAWYRDNSEKRTHPVGQKTPNPWGLFDMLGNVAEWTEDCWHADFRGAPRDGSAWIDGDSNLRVQRGGSFAGSAHMLQSAARTGGGATVRYSAFGFRLAQTIPISPGEPD